MNKQVHFAKRLFQRMGIKMAKLMNAGQKRKMTEAEKEAGGILRLLISDKETDLLTSPTTGKYYIKCNNRQMLLVLGDYELSIINHVYGYNVHLSQRIERLFRDQFLDEIEKRREDMESEFRNSVKHSLKEIHNTLKNEQQSN
jgi:hypothetical protein